MKDESSKTPPKHITQQRVAGSGGVPPSPKLPSLRYGNFGYTRNVMRKAERQDSEKENELMINRFLNPAPRTPAVHGGLKSKELEKR